MRADALEILADPMIQHEAPGYVRSDNGPEFITRTPRDWIAAAGTQGTIFGEPSR